VKVTLAFDVELPPALAGSRSDIGQRRQRSVTRCRIALSVDRLHADLIGAGVEMRPKAARDRLRVPMEHHRIDELVGTTIGEIGFSEADTQSVVAVVGHGHVPT
jgi:hypothetical protein